jgi:hypothetical protein
MARLMMTSMSYSRCLRIAMPIAAGMPNSAMSCTAVYATVVSQAWPPAIPSRAISRHERKPTAVSASHLTCWRSRRPPARYRTASETNVAARNGRNTAESLFSVPTRTVRRTGPGSPVASGFG